MTQAEAVEKLRGKHFGTFGSSGIANEQLAAAAALQANTKDALVLWRALARLHPYAFPAPFNVQPCADWETRPSIEAGTNALVRAMRCADEVLAKDTELTTPDSRALFHWHRLVRALQRLHTTPDASALASIGKELDEALALAQRPGVTAEAETWLDPEFARRPAEVRRRAYELVAAGPPYDLKIVAQLWSAASDSNSCFGWPLAPLTRDARFREHVRTVLVDRSEKRAHPALERSYASLGYQLSSLLPMDEPTPEEVEGRALFLLWAGCDQERFVRLAARALEMRAFGMLKLLLSLGFDPDAVSDQQRGFTLLHLAVEQGEAEAVAMLVASGASATRKSKKKDRKSPLDLARVKKKKAVLAALEGKPAQASTPKDNRFVEELRRASKKLDSTRTRFLGSLFGVKDVAKFVERALANSPETPLELMANLDFVFDRYLGAQLLLEAGYRKDEHSAKTVRLKRPKVVVGDWTIRGALMDGGFPVVVTGNLTVDGLVTASDLIVGGNLCAKDFAIAEEGEETLAVGGDLRAKRFVMNDRTFEAAGDEDVQTLEDDQLAKHFVAEVLNEEGRLDIDAVSKRLFAGRPVMNKGGVSKPAKKKPKR